MFETLRHPVTQQELTRNGNLLLQGDTQVAEYNEAFRRIDWIERITYDGLNNRILQEISKYDNWATNNPIKSDAFKDMDGAGLQANFCSNPNYRELNFSIPEHVQDADILDIGGSCLDAWKFLKAGARTIHQVEVSAKSQELGFQRVAASGEDPGQMMFHTCPAEFLPFADSSFDFVFSRSTIHHTQRPQSIPEIARVLKPGGEALFFEPMRTGAFMAGIIFLRILRRVDRGTDMPLVKRDLQLLNKHFSKVTSKPDNLLVYNAKLAFAWTTKLCRPPRVCAIHLVK